MNDDGVGCCDWCGDDILLARSLLDGGNYFCTDDCMAAYNEEAYNAEDD